jgi:hypothetical protein
VASLFLLASPAPAFNPSLAGTSSTAANVLDWSLSILYQTPSSSSGPALPAIVYPYWISLDANDNLYVSNWGAGSSPTAGNIISLASDGTSRFATAANTTMKEPLGIVPDALGNVWVASYTVSPGSILQFRASDGTLLNTYNFAAGVSSVKALAVDAHNNVWGTTASPSSKSLLELAYNSTTTTWAVNTANQYVLAAAPYMVAVDSNQNIWTTGFTATAGIGTTLGILPNTGTAAAPVYSAIVNPSISPYINPEGIAFDASGHAWVDILGGGNTSSGFLEVTSTGTPISGATTGTFATGTGATLTATISGGAVTHVTVNNGGSGYTSAPAVTFTYGGYTTTATATATVSGGVITAVNVTNGGAGYTYAPTVTVPASPTSYQLAGVALNAVDGVGRVYGADGSGSVQIYDTVNSVFVSESTGLRSCSISSLKCNQTGASSAIAVPRAVAVDSAGTLWTPNDSGSSGALYVPSVVQTFGPAAPAWPLLASGKWATMP